MTIARLKNNFSQLLLLLSLGLTLAYCTMIPKNLADPKVDLTSVNVEKASFTDATLIFNFQVFNPNQIALEVDQIDYNLKVNGKPFTQGTLEKGLQVGANSTVSVPLPVAIRYTDLTSSLTSFLSQGVTPYEIGGSVKLGLLSVPFSKSGELKLSDLQK